MNDWAKIKPTVRYAGVSARTVRCQLRKGLRHSRLGAGTILISYSAIDEYLKGFEVDVNQVDQLVDDTLWEFEDEYQPSNN